MLTSIRAQNHFFKIQTQPKAVSGYDLSLYNSMCVNLGLKYIKVPTDVPSDIDTYTSHLLIQTWFVTSLSCDIDP